MPRVIEKTLFQYDELSDEAKETARDWWKDLEMQDCDLSAVTEDFERICVLFGIELKRHPVQLMGGKTRYDPNIWYSLSYSQGDGASFEGYYDYKPGFKAAVEEYAPQDTKLHNIAAELLRLQKSCGYRARAKITQSGNYSHARTMSAELYVGDDTYMEYSKPLPDNFEAEFSEVIYDLGDWLYKHLQDEYESHLETEYVEDAIRINEYEFDEYGKIA